MTGRIIGTLVLFAVLLLPLAILVVTFAWSRMGGHA